MWSPHTAWNLLQIPCDAQKPVSFEELATVAGSKLPQLTKAERDRGKKKQIIRDSTSEDILKCEKENVPRWFFKSIKQKHVFKAHKTWMVQQ